MRSVVGNKTSRSGSGARAITAKYKTAIASAVRNRRGQTRAATNVSFNLVMNKAAEGPARARPLASKDASNQNLAGVGLGGVLSLGNVNRLELHSSNPFCYQIIERGENDEEDKADAPHY